MGFVLRLHIMVGVVHLATHAYTQKSYAEDRWRNHIALDELRGLPKCEPGASEINFGERYTCIPPLSEKDQSIRYGLEIGLGLVNAKLPLTHSQFHLGAESQLKLGSSFGVGVRYEFGVLGLPGQNPSSSDDAHIVYRQAFTAAAQWRHFTDEVDRNAWALSAGMGYSFHHGDAHIGRGIHLRVALAREVGMYLSDRSVLGTSVVVAHERSLANNTSSLTLGLQGNIEVGVATPRNLHEAPKPASSIRPAYYANFLPWLGAGIEVTTPLVANRLDLTASIDTVFLSLDESGKRYYSLYGGMRLRVASTRIGEIYLRGQGGYSWITTNSDTLQTSWMGTGELGVAFDTCGARVEIGAKTLVALQSTTTEFETGGLAIRFQPVRSNTTKCGRSARVRPDPHDAPRNLDQPRPTLSPPSENEIPGRGDVGADVKVQAKAVVIEVVIGASLFGGAINVQVDPRLLPLGQLRRAARVDVEIIAPPNQGARIQAELRAILENDGIRINSTVLTTSRSSLAIRARFTILSSQ